MSRCKWPHRYRCEHVDRKGRGYDLVVRVQRKHLHLSIGVACILHSVLYNMGWVKPSLLALHSIEQRVSGVDTHDLTHYCAKRKTCGVRKMLKEKMRNERERRKTREIYQRMYQSNIRTLATSLSKGLSLYLPRISRPPSGFSSSASHGLGDVRNT